MPPIKASPFVLADEPAKNPEESRLQGRGLRERPGAGDDETSVPPTNPRLPLTSTGEPWPALKLVLSSLVKAFFKEKGGYIGRSSGRCRVEQKAPMSVS